MKTTLEMAKEVGFADAQGTVHAAYQLERFAELVRADEREACAEVCEETEKIKRWDDYIDGCQDCAAAIRARGNT